MTREEFVRRCDELSTATKYSAQPWHIWLAEMAAHDAEQRAEIEQLRETTQALLNVQAGTAVFCTVPTKANDDEKEDLA